MKASTQRILIRWIHIVLSIPLLGYIYGPLSSYPRATVAVRYIFLPIVVLSGFWMWKGHLLRKRYLNRKNRKPVSSVD